MVVRDRLWRVSDPTLTESVRQRWITALMDARREIHLGASDPTRVARARKAVNQAKVELGERGPVWWTDGASDYNRRMVANTPYAAWWRSAKADHK